MELGYLTLLPPVLAIALAIITKDVVISLFMGIFAGQLLLNDGNFGQAFISVFDGFISLFQIGWITKTILFSLLVGSIIRLITASGGVEGFIQAVSQKRKIINSGKSSLLLAYSVGIVIFIESSITSLIAGTVARPLTQKHGVSPQKLAYICDATSAPVSSLIALNAWGALLIGLIASQIDQGVIQDNPIGLFISSIPYNFYAWLSLILAFIVILKNWNIGSMKRFEAAATSTHNDEQTINNGDAKKMFLPLIVLMGTMPVALYLTGNGDMFDGSGSTSVFYAVVVSLLFTFIYYLSTGTMKRAQFYKEVYAGIGDMLPIALILILAFSIGNITKELGTGAYLAEISKQFVSPILIPLIIFIFSAVIAFSTGTSFGTFSLMMPIAISIGVAMDSHLPLIIGAVVSGGIFGDHSSPLSDTTIIASLAAKCDHIEHVISQLPYALLAGFLASILFVVFAFVH